MMMRILSSAPARRAAQHFASTSVWPAVAAVGSNRMGLTMLYVTKGNEPETLGEGCVWARRIQCSRSSPGG